jgi:hypothetical protein
MRFSVTIFAALLASAVAFPADNNAYADYEKRQIRTTTTTSSSASRKPTGSVPVTRSVATDGTVEYVAKVIIGTQTFTHLLDTGSAADWAFGPGYPSADRGGNKAAYTPGTSAKAYPLGFLDQTYGTMQSVFGPDYTDNVSIGNINSTGSVVGVAQSSGPFGTPISDFSPDTFNGIIGLSPPINAGAQPNWINKVINTLAAPVFCARYLKTGIGSMDFGFIDSTKIVAPVHNATLINIPNLENRYSFNTVGITVGTAPFATTYTYAGQTYADTGAPGLILNPILVQGYYSHVIGAMFILENPLQPLNGTWSLPCTGILPALNLDTGAGYYATIVKASLIGPPTPGHPGLCIGTLQQTEPNDLVQAYGVPLFESQYVVHNPGANTIGFAKRTDVSYVY